MALACFDRSEGCLCGLPRAGRIPQFPQDSAEAAASADQDWVARIQPRLAQGDRAAVDLACCVEAPEPVKRVGELEAGNREQALVAARLARSHRPLSHFERLIGTPETAQVDGSPAEEPSGGFGLELRQLRQLDDREEVRQEPIGCRPGAHVLGVIGEPPPNQRQSHAAPLPRSGVRRGDLAPQSLAKGAHELDRISLARDHARDEQFLEQLVASLLRRQRLVEALRQPFAGGDQRHRDRRRRKAGEQPQ